ncbi:MAG: hypothetical protein MUC64_08610 [Rubritepida sp.]|jgi:hypothetical protein|nr:hypothetical protein [Rubritepida sp.]
MRCAHRRAHLLAWLLLAALLPALLGGAAALRLSTPADAPPLRLATP